MRKPFRLSAFALLAALAAGCSGVSPNTCTAYEATHATACQLCNGSPASCPWADQVRTDE